MSTYDATAPRVHPMGLGDILDTTFSLYRDNFVLFAGIAAVIVIAQAILRALVNAGTSGILNYLLGFAITFAFGALLTGALARAAAARYLGRPMTITEAFAGISGAVFTTLIVTSIIYGLVVGIGLVLLVIPGVYFFVRFIFVPQAVVLEGKSVGAAFGRSSQLVQGSWWRVFGIALVVYLIVAIIIGVVASIVVGGLVVGSVVGAAIAAVVVSAILGILIEPVQYIAMTLLYFDLRIRKECFDLQNLANTLDASPGAQFP